MVLIAYWRAAETSKCHLLVRFPRKCVGFVLFLVSQRSRAKIWAMALQRYDKVGAHRLRGYRPFLSAVTSGRCFGGWHGARHGQRSIRSVTAVVARKIVKRCTDDATHPASAPHAADRCLTSNRGRTIRWHRTDAGHDASSTPLATFRATDGVDQKKSLVVT